MTDNRSSSALFKRAEQLKRWEESDTNKQSPTPRRASRVQFSSGIVFLAACTAGDKDEVQRLLKRGADINTANVDGLTALHQVTTSKKIIHYPQTLIILSLSTSYNIPNPRCSIKWTVKTVYGIILIHDYVFLLYFISFKRSVTSITIMWIFLIMEYSWNLNGNKISDY